MWVGTMSNERPTLFTGVPMTVWYTVTDLQGARYCIGTPVYMSQNYSQAMAVFQGYVPPLGDTGADKGEPYLKLCEFRVNGDGWTETRVLYERRRE